MRLCLFVACPNVSDDVLPTVCVEPGVDDEACGVRFDLSCGVEDFLHACHACPVHDLDGLSATQAAACLSSVLVRVESHRLDWWSSRFDSVNQRGGVLVAVCWLRRVREFCVAHPLFRLRGVRVAL